MKIITLTLALCALAISAFATTPPTLIDTDGPAEGVVTLDLKELWRAGGEDGEVLFGRIRGVVRHSNGEVYVLDNQLAQVEVFGPDGQHRRTLSRQGDGPGEVRQPIGLALLKDDLVGIASGFPGKMIRLKLDGTPVETRYPIGEPSDGNVGVMYSLNSGGGLLGATGSRLVMDSPENSYAERFLAISDAGGKDFTRILEQRTPLDMTGFDWDERADDYFDGRWDLSSDGLLYVATERDRYVVSVFDRTGKLQLTFGCDLKPRKRTDKDKQQVNPMIIVSGVYSREQWDICDYDESIKRIMVNPDDGSIWVLTPNGAKEQPDGILETWDVFSPTGEFLRQAAIPLGNEIRDGSCYLGGDNLLLVVRGIGTSVMGDSREEAAEDETVIEPLEVICYQMR